MKRRFELTEDDRRYLDGLMHDIRQPMQVLGVKVPRLSNALAASPLSEDMAAIAGAIKQEHLLISEIMRKLGYDPRPDAAISSELRETTLLGLLEPLEMMGEQNRDMRIELPTDDLKLFTKPADLYRIVSNLVLNALKHSHGSEVRVTAETDVFDLKLRVTDDGRGFPSGREQMLMRWAMDPSSRPRKEMSGSGLPSCLNLAEALGGKLSLERASKAGTTWLLSIPNVIVSDLAPPQGFASDELRGKVVAVLDDQKAAAESIGQKFRSVGATVVVANSEMDLLRRIHRHEPAGALHAGPRAGRRHHAGARTRHPSQHRRSAGQRSDSYGTSATWRRRCRIGWAGVAVKAAAGAALSSTRGLRRRSGASTAMGATRGRRYVAATGSALDHLAPRHEAVLDVREARLATHPRHDHVVALRAFIAHGELQRLAQRIGRYAQLHEQDWVGSWARSGASCWAARRTEISSSRSAICGR